MRAMIGQVGRALADRAPSRLVHLAGRVREVVAPQPWPYDEAAVGLYRCEQRGRGILPHPAYLYGLLSAARTARAVGVPAITALEFGVAGGNGLFSLRRHADVVREWYGVDVEIVGLDSGAGLLPATDPRDCPFALQEGDFAMDPEALDPSRAGAELVLGDVEATAGPLATRIADGDLPPLGFVSHDLDVYVGTRAALAALGDLPTTALLPRVPMYFDDLTGWPYTTETGERAAITDFNRCSDVRKVGRLENLEHTLGGHARWANWPRMMHLLHVFDHPDYNAPERVEHIDLGLHARVRNRHPAG
ncbi:hypothetical protein [Pseudonocardia endophytica]|uniref:Uncharacterized protein n=1 Tax=Pseudonocardia endophytica TaxID=401976 RepID=A0A4R1HUU9_PSEEN|nr:hypothetical protein [Pseudonocardia endophytica]TCK26038.1 hypothetical protein EV378_1866 [Pseudonocardia endophytica]